MKAESRSKALLDHGDGDVPKSAAEYPVGSPPGADKSSGILGFVRRSKAAEDPSADVATRYNRGDTEAAAEVFLSHRPRLVEMFSRYGNLRVPIEDLVTDTIVRVFSHCAEHDRFPPLERVFQLLRWSTLVSIRSNYRGHQKEPEENEHLPDASDIDPIAVQHLREAIQHLPHKERQTLQDYYLNGLPIAEIAKVTNSSASAVRARLRRARARLTSILRTLWKYP